MPATLALRLLLVFGFAQSGFAQSSNGPLTFGNNFFVTGDYVVAGAYGLDKQAKNGFATGTINVPDMNPTTGLPNPGIQPGSTSTCTINGIPKTNCVPAGAEILAALLYWQTVEKIGVMPGQPGSGQNGFFGPVLNNVPQLYPISGATNSQNTVSFSNGGCTGSSTGKVVRTYRADVRGYLPQDTKGNVLANGTFQVMLASAGQGTPVTLGATVIFIYRILSPNVPLNSIVIYDGSFAPGGAVLNMTQTVQGFYDAANAPVSRLTHIAGSTHSNKFQTVSLNSTVRGVQQLSVNLPSLYANGLLPPFPGWYGPWDNPTWTFLDPNANPIKEDADLATTMVAPTSSQGGCPSWGAVIVSTTVKHTDGDALLDPWKTNQGYCDASINEGSCTAGMPSTGWVDLSGAVLGAALAPHPDVFVQLDYMCSKVTGPGSCDTNPANVTSYSIASNVITVIANNSFSVGENVELQIPSVSYLSDVVLTVSTQSSTQFTAAFTHANDSAAVAGTANGYSFDPRLTKDPVDGMSVVDKVVGAFATTPNHTPVTLHVIPTHAIQEQTCTDISGPPLQLCPFASQAGVVGWPGGVNFFQNQLVDSTSDQVCTISPPGPNCVRRFQRGKKDSWHYALFAHALGLPKWTLESGTLANADPTIAGPNVMQTGTTVTFKTSTPHGLTANINITSGNFKITIQDPTCLSGGRVTVAFAITNPNLNGIYCVHLTADPSIFTIQVPNSASANATYTFSTDPNLVVVPGQATQVSGFSDVGGAHSVIALASWKTKLQTWQAKAGTFMHELGHSLGLTHGGFYFDSLTANNNNYTPTIEANCKPNHQSVMNYDFQIDLLDKFTGLDGSGNPVLVQVPDYSGQTLDTGDKSKVSPAIVFSTTPTYSITAWHGLQAELLGTLGSRYPVYCDGTPIPIGTDLFRVYRPTVMVPWDTDPGQPLFWVASQNIDLDGNVNDSPVLRGHNDWTGTAAIPGIDMRQISATGSLSAAGLIGSVDGGGGGLVGSPEGGGGGVLLVPNGGGGGVVSSPIDGGGGGVLPLDGGGGGLTPIGDGGGGGLVPVDGGGGGLSELTQALANSFARPPTNLTASEAVSPRTITGNFEQPTFGLVTKDKIYRSDAGGPFTVIATLSGNPPATTFTDNPGCNPGGHRYQVTAVVISDITNAEQESVGSNIVSTGQNGQPLTGCYVVSNFLSPANAVQASSVQFKWTLTDASNAAGNPVTRQAANTLVAIGPGLLSNGCTTGRTTLLADGVPTSGGVDAFANVTNQFTFTWINTDAFCAGPYSFELDLDHVNGNPAQVQPDATQLQLSIDVNDTDSTPHITTLPIPNGVVGLAYGDTLSEDGGTAPFKWNFSGSLPPGISQQSQYSPTLSGTTCAAALYNFTATVTDSKSNSGTQALALLINKANTTTGVMSNPNPSVFQQMVTFTVTVAPQYTCTPTGTVTLLDGVVPIASNLPLTGGIATFTTSALSVGIHSITASYGGDSNFNPSNSATLSQTVNKANTMTAFNSVLPSPAFVGQPITVAYNFAVVPPGGGTPIGPSGTITVTASDGSSCMAPAVLGAGACVLSPAPSTAGIRTFTITYPGDNNFVLSGANGNYTVYQLVFTVQPSNTGVGLTMAPAVQVAAEDANNTTLTSFTGGITLAIGSGPGKLSGTTTQPAVSGVATFSDLSINQMANGYTLVASPAGGVASATSNAFNIDGLLFAGSDHNTFALTPLPDQLGRFTVNGPNQDGVGVILSVPYHINGMAQTGKFLYAGDPNTNTLRSIDFNGNPVSAVFSGNASSVAAGFPAACCNEDMAFDGNVLWHAHFNTEIEKLDPATGALMATTLSITNTVANGTTAVFTVPNTVNLIAGQQITVTGCTTAGLNATYTITSVTSTTVTVPSAVNVTEAEPAAQLMSSYGQPDVVGITFVGSTIWITHWSAQQVGTWDPLTNTFTMKFATPANAGGLAYDPVNAILWVGLQGGSIVPYNPVTGSPLNAGFSPLNTGGDTVDGLEFVSKTP